MAESLDALANTPGLLDRVLQALGITSATPATTYHAASQPLQYPTSDDAVFARQYDYSYGQPWAQEFNNNSYRVLLGNPNARNLQAETVSGERMQREAPGVRDVMKDYYARAALAVQNSGLALLGFDPSKVAADVTRDPTHVNMVGFYRPRTDEIYANARDPSAIVHESIHRGIQKLKESPFWRPEFDEILNPENENAVRRIMQVRMGDPEGQRGDIDARQRNTAEFRFTKDVGSARLTKLLDQMEMAASQYMAARRPGGPR